MYTNAPKSVYPDQKQDLDHAIIIVSYLQNMHDFDHQYGRVLNCERIIIYGD
ncbi:protein of unknown function [Shewanella benthica]|uniref:Uncharacterized protein n=1 Tax=Shewanella benthica TaxID=43661 RepID=A0A330M7A6_9GAMM|nr:protein of unknown function [Shewanella benthica]